jgi:hypothetical protein
MRNKSSRSRVSSVLLTCLLSGASLALLLGSAQAQTVSPFEQAELAGEAGSWQFFTLELPAGTVALDVVLSGGTGDADLYVRAEAQPTEALFDCAPFLNGNEETCKIARPQMGAWLIGINAFSAFSGATVKATWSVPPPVDPATPPAALPDWKAQILERHNFYRAQHCAPPLVWDDEIAKSAQGWSDGCVFTHDGVAGTGFGENLAGGFPGENGGAPVDMWYKEVQQYDFAAPGFSPQTGHFTQVVWRGSTRVGCGMTRCPGSIFGWPAEFGEALMYSCRYAPAGNSGMYSENVRPVPEGGVCE